MEPICEIFVLFFLSLLKIINNIMRYSPMLVVILLTESWVLYSADGIITASRASESEIKSSRSIGCS